MRAIFLFIPCMESQWDMCNSVPSPVNTDLHHTYVICVSGAIPELHGPSLSNRMAREMPVLSIPMTRCVPSLNQRTCLPGLWLNGSLFWTELDNRVSKNLEGKGTFSNEPINQITRRPSINLQLQPISIAGECRGSRQGRAPRHGKVRAFKMRDKLWCVDSSWSVFDSLGCTACTTN